MSEVKVLQLKALHALRQAEQVKRRRASLHAQVVRKTGESPFDIEPEDPEDTAQVFAKEIRETTDPAILKDVIAEFSENIQIMREDLILLKRLQERK